MVVGIPEEVQPLPYHVLIVIPLTRTRMRGPLFPLLKADTGGLPVDSTALVYQVTSLDVSRVVGRIGELSANELRPLLESLSLILGMKD